MGFVNEQQHRIGGLLHGVDDIFQTLLEFTLDPGARLQQAQVEVAYADRLEAVRNIAFSDAQGQAFDQRGLAHPGFATRIGLFLRRRLRMSMTWRISSSRPNTGRSALPSPWRSRPG
jgi:hypothetical protein